MRRMGQAIAALEAGRAVESQQLLAQVLRQEPNNEAAWLWMAETVAAPERKRYCIQRASAVNPASEDARRLLAELDGQPAPAVTLVSAPPRRLASVGSAGPAIAEDALPEDEPGSLSGGRRGAGD